MPQLSQGIVGKYLVITDKTALPLRCVKTNEPVGEREYRSWDLPWMPEWLRALMIIMPAFLLFAPYAVRQRCRLKAGLSRRASLRYILIKALTWALILGAMVGPIVLFSVGLQGAAVVGIVLVPIALWLGMLIYVFLSSPLYVAKFSDDRFWITGCCPAFLDSLEDSLRHDVA